MMATKVPPMVEIDLYGVGKIAERIDFLLKKKNVAVTRHTAAAEVKVAVYMSVRWASRLVETSYDLKEMLDIIRQLPSRSAPASNEDRPQRPRPRSSSSPRGHKSRRKK